MFPQVIESWPCLLVVGQDSDLWKPMVDRPGRLRRELVQPGQVNHGIFFPYKIELADTIRYKDKCRPVQILGKKIVDLDNGLISELSASHEWNS